MWSVFRRLGRYLLRGLLASLTLLLLYIFLALIGILIPSEEQRSVETKEIKIFVHKNTSMHTEMILPLSGKIINWLDKMPQSFRQKYKNYQYLAIGWGDYDFYLESRDQPSIITGVKAVLIPSRSIFHLRFYQNQPVINQKTVSLMITQEQYKDLVAHIREKWIPDKNVWKQVACLGYGRNDYFFESKGYYHLFYTCNTWTNDCLKAMHIRTALWTPFATGVWSYLQ